MRRALAVWWLALLAGLVVIGGSRRALAEARVLVLSPVEERPRPTLIEALRLHLRGTARVELSRALLPAVPAPSRVALAAELVRSQGVDFALWLESVALGNETRFFALYVVGARDGRAVLEVARLPAQVDSPDVDRTLALKASEIIEVSLAGSSPLSNRPAPTATELPAPAPSKSPEPLAPEAPRHVALELGGILSGASLQSTQSGLALGASWLFATAPLEMDVRLFGQLWTDTVATRPGLRVHVADTFVGAGFGARSTGTVQLGMQLALGSHLLRAEGFAAGASTGTATLGLPSLSFGPELRLRLGRRISFGAGAYAEWMAIRQSFDVGGVPVEDWGRFRLGAQLSLIFYVL